MCARSQQTYRALHPRGEGLTAAEMADAPGHAAGSYVGGKSEEFDKAFIQGRLSCIRRSSAKMVLRSRFFMTETGRSSFFSFKELSPLHLPLLK